MFQVCCPFYSSTQVANGNTQNYRQRRNCQVVMVTSQNSCLCKENSNHLHHRNQGRSKLKYMYHGLLTRMKPEQLTTLIYYFALTTNCHMFLYITYFVKTFNEYVSYYWIGKTRVPNISRIWAYKYLMIFLSYFKIFLSVYTVLYQERSFSVNGSS